jgi:hypothetical protein
MPTGGKHKQTKEKKNTKSPCHGPAGEGLIESEAHVDDAAANGRRDNGVGPACLACARVLRDAETAKHHPAPAATRAMATHAHHIFRFFFFHFFCTRIRQRDILGKN